MKIIEPSATIIEKEFAGLSVCQRIDRLASVCYQRPPRPTEEEAEAFCRNLIERGHLPALEMAVVHLVMGWVQAPVSKFLLAGETVGQGEHRLISGSVRGFLEAEHNGYTNSFLAQHLPVFFQPDYRCSEHFIRFATPEEIPWQHKHVAVRVICSRAISHQLVRHRPCSFLQESARYCRYDDGVMFIRPEWVVPRKHEDWFALQCSISESVYLSRTREGLSPQQARGALNHDVKTELIMYASLPEWKHIFAMRCAKAADPEMRRIMVPLREQFKAEYPEMWEEA
jgi:thymidylate synthase (FAD)